MKRLEGKTAIITGGANGIGFATTLRFLEEGASVAIWDVSGILNKKDKSTFEQYAEKVRFYRVDVTDLDAVIVAAKKVKEQFGSIDILVNNAGITRDASLKKMEKAQWQQVIDVNLTGVFNCTKAVYSHMAGNGWGRILNAASVVAHNGNFGQTNYVAAKAGVIGMTKTWAREFGRKGITVNAVAPGFIQTNMVKTVPEEILKGMANRSSLVRLGEPIDIANAYLFLASDEAKFITGTCLNVDGGLVF